MYCVELSVNYEDALMGIIKDNGVCYSAELKDRYYQETGKWIPSDVYSNWLRNKLVNGHIKVERVDVGYRYPATFIKLSTIDDRLVDRIIEHKTKLLRQQRTLTNITGKFGEELIASALSKCGCSEIETTKKKHSNIGNDRQGIDVFTKHPDGHYLGIEVKNRKPSYWLNCEQIKDDLGTITEASIAWGLDIKPAIICTFIYPKAMKKYKDEFPILATGKQYVPEENVEFYRDYRDALGANYVTTIADVNNPPEELVKNIQHYIVSWEKNKTILWVENEGVHQT